MKKRIVCSLLVAWLLLPSCSRETAPHAPKAEPPRPVQVVCVFRGEIARTVKLPAYRILAWQAAILYAKVTGYLKTLTVDKGDSVKEGQELAEIEVPELYADQARYEAESLVGKANYDRVAAARKKAPDLVVPQTVDDLYGQWKIAEAQLQRTRTSIGYTHIIAPFSGIITTRFVDPGAYIAAATTGNNPQQNAAIVTLMDFATLRVQVFTPESEVPFIKNGVPVVVTVAELPGRAFPFTVSRFAYALDEATKTMLTEIDLPNPTLELRPGMFATVAVELERKSNALLLPIQAVTAEKAGSFVFVVADEKAKRIKVETGFHDEKNVEIVQGLQEGQPAVLSGQQTLTEGQSVKPVEAK